MTAQPDDTPPTFADALEHLRTLLSDDQELAAWLCTHHISSDRTDTAQAVLTVLLNELELLGNPVPEDHEDLGALIRDALDIVYEQPAAAQIRADLLRRVRLHEIHLTVTGFLKEYGHSSLSTFLVAQDLANSILKILTTVPAPDQLLDQPGALDTAALGGTPTS